MTVKTEGARSAEFCLSEANGFRSRETVVIISGQNLGAGQVLGKITASGKYTAYVDDAVDGSQTAAAVLYADCDASGGDKEAVAFVRDAEVNGSLLVWGVEDQSGGKVDLAGFGIIVR